MTDLLDLVILFDQNGYIEDLLLPEDVTQQFETGADFLEHYGVKGMKWGVRRSVTGHIKNRPTAARGEAPTASSSCDSTTTSRTSRQRPQPSLEPKPSQVASTLVRRPRQHSRMHERTST